MAASLSLPVVATFSLPADEHEPSCRAVRLVLDLREHVEFARKGAAIIASAMGRER